MPKQIKRIIMPADIMLRNPERDLCKLRREMGSAI